MTRCSDYIGHYRIDAEEFDYFTNRDPVDSAYEKLFHNFIGELCGASRNFVDIGSGGGWSASIPHETVFHVDLSMRNLGTLKSDKTAPVLADAHHLPFKDASLELVIASEILEHLNSPEEAAKEIWRIMRPGGRAIVSTPYKEKIRYTLCVHCNKPTPWNAHLHSFDRKALLSLFPPEAMKRSYVFGNKLLVFTRMPLLFKHLPLIIWRLLDGVLTAIVDRAQHIVVVIGKS